MPQNAESGRRSRPILKRNSLGSQHQEDILDEALTETFPASDPVAISFPKPAHSAGSFFVKHTEGDEARKTAKSEDRHQSTARRNRRC